MSNEATPAPARPPAQPAPGNIASYIDHTLLKPEASEADILKVCAEAAEYRLQVRLREPRLGQDRQDGPQGLRGPDLLGGRVPAGCHAHAT